MASAARMLDVDGIEVKVSSPDRVVYPKLGATKLEVVEYYLSVGEGILGAVRERPTTLERWSKGVLPVDDSAPVGPVNGDFFYQKHIPKGMPGYIDSVRIRFPSGRPGTEICPTNLATVAWAAQMGTITFHPWPVTRADVDNPDQLRIDLDPQPGTDFADAVRASVTLREVLAEHGLAGFPKTSGGRGLHVYVPIRPEWDFIAARRALIALGREVELRVPDEVTMSWWKEERGTRVFIDYNQMARDRTIASAYSLRANEDATVSAPLHWDEVDDVRPGDFTIRTMPQRFAEHGDLHADLASAEPGDLSSLLELSAAHEREHGWGEAPFPPDYPKMPGEPPRVQPSKKNPDNW